MQPSETAPKPADLRTLLPRGSILTIARSLNISHTAVSRALRKASPTHPAVAEAVRLIKEAGTQTVRRDLARLTK